MKVTKILIAMLASAFIVTACDPIEDEDLLIEVTKRV